MFVSVGFSRECLVRLPAEAEPLSDCSNGNPMGFGPLGQALGLPVYRDVSVLGCVSGLFGSSGPSAIVRRVSAIVVDALDGLTGWALAHVGQKSFKVKPFVADANAPGPVSVKALAFGVAASINHVLPGQKFSSSPSPLGLSMSGDLVYVKASAAASIAPFQGRAVWACCAATVAKAFPSDLAVLGALCGHGDNHQSSESVSGEIQGLHFASMCASMMRLTSSAIEIPRRLASFFRKARWGSVNEIICLVMLGQLHEALLSKLKKCNDSSVSPASSVSCLVVSGDHVALFDDLFVDLPKLVSQANYPIFALFEFLGEFGLGHTASIPVGISRG